MSLDERTMLPDEPNNVPTLALPHANTLSQPVSGSLTRPIQDMPMRMMPAVDLMTYLHAFRRHWLLAVGLGLVVAIIVGPAIWFGMGARYTASGYLRVAYQKEALVFTTGERPYEAEYESLKNTQMQYILNRFVLLTALKKPEGNPISKLSILKTEQDPAGWLIDNLIVSFPNKAEIMEVSITTNKAEEAAEIVTAVIDAYMSDVVDSEKEKSRRRLNELDHVFTDRDREVRNKRIELKQLAEELGTAETETLNLKQRLTLEELAMYRNELVRSEFEVGRLKGELAARQAELEAVTKTEVSDMEGQMFAQNDPLLKNLLEDIMYLKKDAETANKALAPGAKSRLNRYQTELDQLEGEYRTRLDLVKTEISTRRRTDVEKEIKRLEAAIDIARKQQTVNEEEVQNKRTQAQQFGNSSVDVEMLRNDIRNRELSLASILGEREKLKVELNSPSRVSALQRKVEKPLEASNFRVRIVLTTMGMLFALCLPTGGVVLWDTRYQRVNKSADVADQLGVAVIGSLPIIPGRVLRQLGSPSKRNQLWQLRLTESVDGIAARLLRRAELEQRRVVMVTSAVSGEGKTTLAAQLAMSLARAGRRTVLVDFDLRQPSFDDAFGLEKTPGISEILRGESDLAGAIQTTPTGNLSVITAGRWNRLALSALANGAANSLFKELRDEYEFVVIDTSPILPIADARFVSQYVDSVVLCVFRDVSEVPRIRAACEILEAFGVHCIDAAVTEAREADSGRSGYYQSSISS